MSFPGSEPERSNWRTPLCLLLIALFGFECNLCHGQTAKVIFDLISRQTVEARLKSFTWNNSKREVKLHELFVEAGCKDAALSEQLYSRKRPPNVICTMQGTTDSIIVVGAHFDHPMGIGRGIGVVDDWSGASLLPTLFESLCRAPRRHTFVFVGFGGEEMGMAGSKYYVNKIPTGDLAKFKAMVNLECLGLGPTNVWASYADPRLLASYAHVVNALKMPLRGVNVERVGRDDAMSFSKHGIRTISIHSVTQETLAILHSPNDNLKAIRLDDYYESYRLIAAYLAYIDSTLGVNESQRGPQSE